MVNTGFWSSSSSSSGGIGSSNSNSDSSDSSSIDDTGSGGAADSDGSSSSPSRLSRWSRKIRSFRHKIPSSSKHHHHRHLHRHNNRRHSTDTGVTGSSCVRCNGNTPPPLLPTSAATAEGISCSSPHLHSYSIPFWILIWIGLLLFLYTVIKWLCKRVFVCRFYCG